jgi:hypothetical protein
MAEYTTEDKRRADQIAGSLLEGDRHRFHGELDKSFSIVDVEADAAEFRRESDALERISKPFLAIELPDGPPVPVSITFWGLVPRGVFDVDFYEYSRGPLQIRLIMNAYEALYDNFVDRPLFRGFTTISISQARESFSSRAAIFLATRLTAVKSLRPRGGGSPTSPTLTMPQYFGGPPANNIIGCYFSVTSNSPGLTAHWSGAYFISPNYLGPPTSPAVGILQAERPGAGFPLRTDPA